MRGALKVLLVLAIVLFLGVLTLPWWLGAALRPLARAQGASFERYATVGYTRFRLEGVTFARRSVNLSAKTVTLDTPVAWLLRRSRAHAEISEWTLHLLPAETPATAQRTPAAPAEVHAQIRHVLESLRRWLPRLDANAGAIARGQQTWRIARASWADGTLRAEGTLPTEQPLRATFTERDAALVATAELPAFAARADLTWTRDALRATGKWWDQPFDLDADLGGPTWRPTRAELRAENWDVPAARLKLAPAYERVRGHVRARWADGGFLLDARAEASPAAGRQLPPLTLNAQAAGNPHRIVIRSLDVRAPFANATLSAPLTFSFDGGTAAQAAVLAVDADLSRQTWIDAVGKITGEIRVQPRGAASRGEFTATIDSFRWRELTATSARLRGQWEPPRVQVDELAVTLDAESRIVARGAFDWTRRELSATRVDATLAATWAARFLPDGVAFEKIETSFEADGPLGALRHRGELNATKVRANRLRPLALTAQWTGEGRTLNEFSASARSGNAALQLAGSLAPDRASLREVALLRDGRELLRGVAPAELRWRPTLKIDGVRLEGAESALALDLEWSEAPRFYVSAQKLPSEWLGEWWSGRVPPSRIDALNVRGEFRAGVLIGEAALDAAAQIEGEWMQGRLTASAQTDGVRVSQLEIADARGLMAYADGRVPARVLGSRPLRVEFDPAAPLELDAAIAPDSPLWDLLRQHTSVAVERGAITASLTGSLQDPRGTIRVEAAHVGRRDEASARTPAEITDLLATVQARRDGLQLESLDARVAGHPVHASGRLPIDDAGWRTLLRTPRDFDWRRAELELVASRVELAALARTFPVLPFTQGTLAADLRFAGGELTGRAELRDGASRSLGALGRLLAIEADLALAGRRIDVRKFSAQLGGEPVQLTGTAALDGRERLDLDLRLEAKNVPLVRRPGLLVRTDLDLRAQTPARGPTRISGAVELRDALVMADLAAILPGGPRGVSRAPPYFSVRTEPFSRWALDVRIGGHRSVRASTAVFNGVATPQFHLIGTLGDPRAIGQLTVDDGQVLFPFARFDVQQGTLRLTEAEPTQPRLAVNAGAKRMGYELRLEAGGTLAAPTLAFSSNPPLDSADILLLVTTGQPPRDETAAPTSTQRLTRLGTFLGRGIFQNFGGGEERLEISSGEQVSEAGRETYRVEYKLREKLSLTGEYDRYDAYNAGIKYRLYTQEGAKRDERKK